MERRILYNALCAEQVIAECYNHAVGECGEDETREVFLSLLSETHEAQRTIYQEMERRGWLPHET